jgi:polar amino acid transport system substrate-binding protein
MEKTSMNDSGIDRRTVLQLLGAATVVGCARPAFAAQTSLDDIKKAGVLRVGCEAVLPPFTFREGGKIVGYDVDVAALICKPLGVKPEMIDTAWAGIIPALYAGRFDIIMSQMTYTKPRLEKVGFAIPYVEASLAMLVRAGDANKIKSTKDLVGRSVGVELGSPGEILQKKLNDEWTAGGGKGFEAVRTYDDYPAAYLALSQGSIDAVFNALPTLTVVLKDAPGKYAIVRGINTETWAGIATRKENTDLVAYLDDEIRKIKDSGEIYALQEKWFGIRMQLPDAVPPL